MEWLRREQQTANGERTGLSSPRAPSPEPRTKSSGFTLIELLLVLVILSITAALVVPRLPSTDAMELKSSARSLASLLRYLGERSISSKNIYRLHVNLRENSIMVTRKLANGDEVPPEDPLLSRNSLTAGIVIADLQSPRLGKVTEGEVVVDFGSAGLSEFLILHLSSSKGENFTVTGYPQGGKVKILSGYQEVTL